MSFAVKGFKEEKLFFLRSWKFFSIAAIPGFLSNFWVIFRSPNYLEGGDFIEWAVLSSTLVLISCFSQVGIKPGYMQEVTDLGLSQRSKALKTSLIVLAWTGGLAGIIVMVPFYILSMYEEWNNTSVLFVMPLLCISTNLYVIFQTDLRINKMADVLANMAIVQTIIFFLFFETFLFAGLDFLLSFYMGTALSLTTICIFLWSKSNIHSGLSIDYTFVRRALKMGSFFLASLLCRYASDAIVMGSFKWLSSDTIGGLLGISVKLSEPIVLLYFTAIQMAWGSHVYSWIKQEPKKLLSYSNWVSTLLIIGFFIGLGICFFICSTLFNSVSFTQVLPFVLMLLSRATAFAFLTTVGFGQTIKRSYKSGFKFNLFELLLTVCLTLLCLQYSNWIVATVICGLLPWLTVFLLRTDSLNVLKKTLHNHIKYS